MATTIARITRVSRVHFRDNGQHKIYIHWTDTAGACGMTEGERGNFHTEALLDRARREGITPEPERKWG